ncbi:unnamed protein product [Mycena citricolor]|uniref:Mif2/CENP-C cupin domain-containing protein n=1 Tax=Mycena citricolor TaxID=2018698 RepID=A0AAD2HS40_9AGAR|nr:unnamed protein product [Mycena citricolor]
MARTPSKPKAHVPYRGDDLSVGRKTGVKVPRIQRKSDGFEPFNELFNHADDRTPPRRKKKSVSRAQRTPEDEDEDEDEYGEASMDLDSPIQQETASRRASTSRVISRTRAVDFDEIPSPRKTVGRASRTAPRHTAEEDAEEEDAGRYFDEAAQMDENEEEEDEEDQIEPASAAPASRAKSGRKSVATISKGKGRQLEPVDDEEDEDNAGGDDFTRELEAIDDLPPSDEEADEVETPPRKKPRASTSPKKREPKSKPKSKPVSVAVERLARSDTEEPPEGVRRSRRTFYAPLEWWRGEHRVYEPRHDGEIRQVPHIKEIVRIPKEPPPSKAPASKRKRTRPTPETRIIEQEVIVEVDASNPERGWDHETRDDPSASVIDYETQEEVVRRLAFTEDMFDPKAGALSASSTEADQWYFQKIMSDSDFVAAGQLLIEPKKRKPIKSAKENTYVCRFPSAFGDLVADWVIQIFYVISGAVSALINNQARTVTSGGMFMVPRGNQYMIENICDREAKLFFTQAKQSEEAEIVVRKPRAVASHVSMDPMIS